MHVSQLVNSKYLKQSDFERPALMTIDRVQQETMQRDDGDDELKWVMYFREAEKGLVMNLTNGQLAARALGSDDSDDWIGRQIVVYTDPNVSFGGKVVGGLRLRAPKQQGAPAQSKPSPARAAQPIAPQPIEDMDDDIPF